MNIKKVSLIILLVIIFGVVGVILIKSNNKATASISNDTSEESNGADIELTDDHFLVMLDELYVNYDDYKGKTVSYQGFIYHDVNTNNLVVGRYYYCCGYDSYIVGMECDYDGEQFAEMQWVKVTGVIKINRDDPQDVYPYLKVTSMEKTEEGNQYVNY